MLVFPNCKINVGLLVKAKRPDGYHNIETVFYPVQWTDALEMVPSNEFKFEQEGLHIPGDPDNNIIIQAYQLLKKQYDISPVHCILQKHIPVGAGLGGGSANAAFAIKALNDLFELNLSNKELKKLVSQLGADCSFFIDNQPLFASGIGDQFEEIDLSLKDKQIIVVYPRSAINTAWAYTQLKFDQKELPSPKQVVKQPIEEWKEQLRNDFEREVVKVLPAVKSTKNAYYEAGALYASMSGSGSSIYGIFEEDIDLEPIKKSVDNDGFKIYSGKLQ